VVDRARFEGDAACAQRRLANPEPGHAPQHHRCER
jgi:hypothetical protein